MAGLDDSPYEPLFTPTERSSQQNALVQLGDGAHSARASRAGGPPASVKEQPLESQNSLLHQNSGYLKQATSGFMRWQSRRAFWSAVDPAAGPEERQLTMGVACANSRSALAYWFKTVAEVSRRHPAVLLAPLLLAAACIGGGLAGVIVGAQQAKQSARDDTATVARQAASALELMMDSRGLQPAAALAGLAAEVPDMAALGAALPGLLPGLLLQPQSSALSATPVQQIALAPFGIVNVSYSPPAAAAGQQQQQLFPVGSRVWAQGAGGGGAAAAVELAIQRRIPVVATVVSSGTAGSSDVLLVSYNPVYVSGVAAGETWGNVVPPADYLAAACGSGDCFNASSGTKLWGFSISVVSLSALAASPGSGLQGLADGEYKYRFTVLPSGAGSWVQVAESRPPPQSGRGTAAVLVRLAGPRAGSTAVSAGTEGELFLDHDDGWQITWEGPLIAVVIVASLALSAFLFAMLFNYMRHMSMLQAMLPEKVIRVLETGSNYYQHFDCVTVLYADVVRYTAAQPQQGNSVPTLEVVKLLNDVHSMYETIMSKYGLVRIRRSGESFLAVGGCPTPDDPVAVAVRVASCARDLLLATSRFRGSGGFRVQLRIGMHSGPAVAAVVGSKMPRFSLFGDVVDVAYYMEATSRPMAVHLSDVTSQLLERANDPLLQLRPRGRLDILGQGSMNSCWLRLDQLPNPAEAAAAEGDEPDRPTSVGPAASAAAAAAAAAASQDRSVRRGGHGGSSNGGPGTA